MIPRETTPDCWPKKIWRGRVLGILEVDRVSVNCEANIKNSRVERESKGMNCPIGHGPLMVIGRGRSGSREARDITDCFAWIRDSPTYMAQVWKLLEIQREHSTVIILPDTIYVWCTRRISSVIGVYCLPVDGPVPFSALGIVVPGRGFLLFREGVEPHPSWRVLRYYLQSSRP